MQNGTESPLVTAQRNAILQVRGRYERGELPIETFRGALDALTAAQSPEECEAILRDLPPAPLAVLAALEPAPLAPVAPSAAPSPAPASARRHITAFMSETRKTRNAWTLAPDTHVRAFMGSVQLDLRRAQLPPDARIKINCTMGEVKVIVPEDVAVTVMSRVWLGESHALGESVEGMVASGHEEYVPTQAAPRARLLIEVGVLMGSSHINLANQAPISISELVRDTLRLALENTRRSLEAGATPPALPQPGPTPTSLPQPGAPAE